MTPQSKMMTMSPEQSVLDAMALMNKNGFRHIPVVQPSLHAPAPLSWPEHRSARQGWPCAQVSGGNYLGMISIRDTVRQRPQRSQAPPAAWQPTHLPCAGPRHGVRAQVGGRPAAGVHPGLLLSWAAHTMLAAAPAEGAHTVAGTSAGGPAGPVCTKSLYDQVYLGLARPARGGGCRLPGPACCPHMQLLEAGRLGAPC